MLCLLRHLVLTSWFVRVSITLHVLRRAASYLRSRVHELAAQRKATVATVSTAAPRCAVKRARSASVGGYGDLGPMKRPRFSDMNRTGATGQSHHPHHRGGVGTSEQRAHAHRDHRQQTQQHQHFNRQAQAQALSSPAQPPHQPSAPHASDIQPPSDRHHVAPTTSSVRRRRLSSDVSMDTSDGRGDGRPGGGADGSHHHGPSAKGTRHAPRVRAAQGARQWDGHVLRQWMYVLGLLRWHMAEGMVDHDSMVHGIAALIADVLDRACVVGSDTTAAGGATAATGTDSGTGAGTVPATDTTGVAPPLTPPLCAELVCYLLPQLNRFLPEVCTSLAATHAVTRAATAAALRVLAAKDKHDSATGRAPSPSLLGRTGDATIHHAGKCPGPEFGGVDTHRNTPPDHDDQLRWCPKEVRLQWDVGPHLRAMLQFLFFSVPDAFVTPTSAPCAATLGHSLKPPAAGSLSGSASKSASTSASASASASVSAAVPSSAAAAASAPTATSSAASRAASTKVPPPAPPSAKLRAGGPSRLRASAVAMAGAAHSNHKGGAVGSHAVASSKGAAAPNSSTTAAASASSAAGDARARSKQPVASRKAAGAGSSSSSSSASSPSSSSSSSSASGSPYLAAWSRALLHFILEDPANPSVSNMAWKKEWLVRRRSFWLHVLVRTVSSTLVRVHVHVAMLTRDIMLPYTTG